MKKLLVFMLVLGLASWALATPYFEISGPLPIKDSYEPSEWIEINLMDDGMVTGFLVECITDNPGGVQIGEAAEPVTFNSGFQTVFPGELNYDGQLVAYVSAYVTSVPPPPVTGKLYSFMYHVPDVPFSTLIPIVSYVGNDDYVSEIYYKDGSYYSGVIDGLEIHVVPEPATIALLGLGGLLLRRRK